MNLNETTNILVTCPMGLPPFVERELHALGFDKTQPLISGVRTRGTMADCMRLNLNLRTGHRVMYELASFKARTADDLYKKVKAMPWERIIPRQEMLTVSCAVKTQAITDSRFANQRMKDAVVDRIREKTGGRPDAGPKPIGVCLFLHWEFEQATISIDTTGEPLSRRGYRKRPHKAPLQETLAAACVLKSSWPETAAQGGHLVNPMCGAGTLAIEGALLAANRAPGLTRQDFAFTHLRGFDHRAFRAMFDEAKNRVLETIPGRILATDHDPSAIEAAQDNAEKAGVAHMIEFAVCDFRQAEIPPSPGTLIMNPEYGKRLGEEEQLAEVYKAIGDFFKQSCPGYMAYIITGNMALAKRVGLRTKSRTPLYNADIECRLLEYELYKGTRKVK